MSFYCWGVVFPRIFSVFVSLRYFSTTKAYSIDFISLQPSSFFFLFVLLSAYEYEKCFIFCLKTCLGTDKIAVWLWSGGDSHRVSTVCAIKKSIFDLETIVERWHLWVRAGSYEEGERSIKCILSSIEKQYHIPRLQAVVDTFLIFRVCVFVCMHVRFSMLVCMCVLFCISKKRNEKWPALWQIYHYKLSSATFAFSKEQRVLVQKYVSVLEK